MCIKIIDNIPHHLFNQWQEIFKQTNGRYIRNPFEYPRSKPEFVRVECEFDNGDDYRFLWQRYKLLTTPIKETTKARNKFLNIIRNWRL